jgi:DNA-binding transcriptional ArsR family regulator
MDRTVSSIGKSRCADTIGHVDTADDTRLLEVCKALANPTRLQIMRWLRDPTEHFAPQPDPIEEVGVCVKQIQEKAGVSQSTASQFMQTLQRAGLVTSQRRGAWTYYQRNDRQLAALPGLLGETI